MSESKSKGNLGYKLLFAAGALTASFLLYRFIIRKPGKLMGAGKFASTLTANALSEYEAWGKGIIKEGDAKTMDRLRSYWKEGAGVKNWTDKQMINEAWSAAFISYVMRKSGAGTDWKYAPSHSVYIADSVRNRKQNNDKPFKGYKPHEVKVEVGDLVGKARQAGVTYDSPAGYLSHTDIVVAIKDGYAETIGGNVSNSVSMTKVPLTADGKLDVVKAGGKYPYFVVIKNGKQ